MGWPTPQDYNEAIQNTQICFFDSELKNGVVQLNKLGIPASITGSFASVYSVSTDKHRYAVRCLLHDFPDQQLRYERLSKAICSDSLEYTTDFEYQKEGIKVGNKAFPIVKMLWIAGENLDLYIEKNYSKPKKVKALRNDFLSMSRALMNEGFAHGDLQHGNIIMTKDGIRLVDYDGMFVPSLTGLLSNELGHRNYQHPGRTKHHFGPYLDNFSAWVIDTTLFCLELDPTLYEKWHTGNEAIIFEQKDFQNPQSSELFAALETHDSEEIRNASRQLRTIINCLVSNVPGVFDEVPLADELEIVLKKRKQAALAAEWKAAEEMLEKQRELDKEALRLTQTEQDELREKLKTIEHDKPEWLKDAENLMDIDAENLMGIEHNKDRISAQKNQTSQNPAALKAVSLLTSKEMYAKEIKYSDDLELVFPDLIVEKDEAGEIKDYGSNNAVYKITYATNTFALKFFAANAEELTQRYSALSNHLDNAHPSLQDVLLKPVVHEQLLTHQGTKLPGIQMPWLWGAENLGHFIRVNKPDFDYSVLTSFRKAMKILRLCGVAHGSLEPSNIMVDAEYKITFVDYDNIYFDKSCKLLESSKPAAEYRHPLFDASEFGPSADNFPAWVIDTMLMCWSADRRLWRENENARGTLFFTRDDFANPNGSELMGKLLKHQVYDFTQRAKLMLLFSRMRAADVPPLTLDGFPPPGFI